MSDPRLVFPLVHDALKRDYDRAVSLSNHMGPGLARQADSYCYGLKQFGKPMMALTAQKKLGPVRHALSQMVVAGTLFTPAPVQVRITSEEPDASASVEE